jgi:hypothetical protein
MPLIETDNMRGFFTSKSPVALPSSSRRASYPRQS